MITEKRTLCRLFALLLCVGLLSGCGGEGDTPNSPSGSTESPAQSAGPSTSPEESSPEPTLEPEAEDDSWKDVLRSIPYCGDAEKCAMTAGQALAYAQLLADGIAGKVPVNENNYAMAQSDVLFWDTPYTVWGYSGEYQTDRANAILGSFAGDGQPYVCVLSSDHPDCGFDIYYSDGGEAKFVYGAEAYGGRWYATFNLDTDGKMTISTGGSGGAASHYAERLILAGGEAKTQHSWSQDYNYETGMICVTKDGVETYYTTEEYEYASMEWESNIDWEELPDTPFTPIPLREMITYLNQYAAAKGSDQSVTVAEPSEQSKMAQAMLAALEAETDTGGYDWVRVDARLVDLDKDGIAELVTYNGSTARLHWWENGQLQTKEVGFAVGGWVEWWLCRDTDTGELGIEWRVNGGGDFTGGTSTFYYFSHEISIGDHCGIEEGDQTRYSVGEQKVTQAEFDAYRARNQRVEELISESGSEERLEQARAALEAML